MNKIPENSDNSEKAVANDALLSAAAELELGANDLASWYEGEKQKMPPSACRAIRREIDRVRDIAIVLQELSDNAKLTDRPTL